MSETFAVYIPAGTPGPQNLRTGLSSETWGWRFELARKHLVTVQNLAPGDGLILATGAPTPRVAPGGWAGVSFKQFYMAEVTKGHHLGDSALWQDEVESGSVIYPERIKFELTAKAPTSESTSPEVAEALRLSANTKGAPILVGETSIYHEAFSSGDKVTMPSGDLDVPRLVKTRREQSRLQKHLFGGLSMSTCALCSKSLPVELLRAAHIKRRDNSSYEERINLANVMAACTLGCDELFERGYLYVDDSGVLKTGTTESAVLQQVLKGYARLKVDIYSPNNASFFEWHRRHHKVST